ncbi:MAG TPA: hypothetical protein VFV36_05365 [Candidatus Methylomirabilis sp.]|nr:hypothetical protein [Candidatus Methylomirabilis sp.]
MTLDEYISELRALRSRHGGQWRVVDSREEPLSPPEFHDDPGDDPVVVVCDVA